jgi:hypothetical protein
MPVLIGALLALLVVGVVLYPFVKRRFGVASPSGGRPGDTAGPAAWRLRREEIYESIRGLQLEYEIGGVEETDYRERLRAYRVQAAAVVREQELAEREQELAEREQELAEREVERLVERDVRALRGAGRPGPLTAGEQGMTGHSTSERVRESPAEGYDGPGR